MEGILISIKSLLGVEGTYTHFDDELVMHINSVFFTLTQMGVGPVEGFSIKDNTATWEEYFGTDKFLEAVKMYIYLKVRLSFDPPAVSFVLDAIQRQISELEFRLMTQVDIPILEVVEEEDVYGL